jgi:MFS family permease
MKENNFLKILNNKIFLRILLIQFFSSLSAITLNFVLIGKIYSITHSSVAIAFFIFFYYLPTVLLGFFAGVLIDNFSKKSIFIFSNLAQSIIVIFYLGIRQKIWPIYLIVFLYSLCDEFLNPAIVASLPAVIDRKYLTAANSLTLFISQGTIIGGSLMGGILLKSMSNENYIFILVSGLLIFCTVLSLTLPSRKLRGIKKLKIDLSDPLNISRALDFPGFWRQTKEGYLFIKSKAMVLFPLLLLCGLGIIVGMGMVLFPSLAEILKIEYADATLFIVPPVIFGAIFGGFLVNKLTGEFRKSDLVAGGLFLLGGGVLGLTLLSLIASRFIVFSIFLMFLLGLGYVLIYVPLQTLLQEHTPFNVRGRVFGVLSTLVTLLSALPMLLVTTLVDIFGVRLILLILGGGLIILGILANRKKEEILSFNFNYKKWKKLNFSQ